MTKQQYLLSVINAIPDWEMGRGLKTLIENNQIEEATLDKLVVIFKGAIQRIVRGVNQHKILERTKSFQLDQADIGQLESVLSSF